MNKVNIFLTIIVITLLSCGKKPKTSDTGNSRPDSKGTNAVDSLKLEVDSFHVIQKEQDCKDMECSSCDLYYERIKNPFLSVHDSVNRYIDTLMSQSMREIGYTGAEIDLKKTANYFIETSKDDTYSGAPWDWSHHTSVYIRVKEIIAVSTGFGGYTGGAHGNYYSGTTNFFISNGKKVTMNDLFTDVDKVNRLAVKYFKQDNQLDPNLDINEQGFMMGDEGFTLNENFEISAQSIAWQFNSYEIGPYMAGAPSVTIPLKDLKPYLKVKITDL